MFKKEAKGSGLKAPELKPAFFVFRLSSFVFRLSSFVFHVTTDNLIFLLNIFVDQQIQTQ